ncbi:MAG: tyrosine--tRNA ligase [Firmicutes bacterium]|nr:tyrosine--tRNA ligase [Bacillota bacterium]
MSKLVLDFEKQWKTISRGAVEIIPQEELVQKLRRSLAQNRPLKIKLGLDPTAPDIHLGHTVVLHKLRQFQELGHEVVLILGDFTARIGDPSGRTETRKQLTEAEVMANMATYKAQIGKIIDLDRAEVVFNSTWLAPLSFTEVIELAAKYTVARMLERDDFARRYREGLPIGVHEFLYPLIQAYDSVVLRADVEIGGTDQKFNLMVGRDLQREYGQEPQVAVLMPILEGLDGVQKMSKSLGNYIGITEPPEEIYGKTMSIPDELILRYFELVTPVDLNEIQEIKNGLAGGSLHPRDAKMRLARELVSLYYDAQAARHAEEEFIAVFQRGEMPEEIPEVFLDPGELEDGERIWLPKLLVKARLANSTSAGKRLIAQGAVKIEGEKILDADAVVPVNNGMVIRAGKRKFARICLKGTP